MSEKAEYQGGWNFLGLPEELATRERAQAWVLPVPYEATTSYGAGTRNGPAAIIHASRQVELFDRVFDGEPACGFGVHTLPPLGLVHSSPRDMIENVATAVAEILSGSPAPRLLAILGGEHSLSAGVARGIARALPREDLVAVQIDAHADLRDSYEGSPYSHACAARRILDTCPVFQIGIRNISAGEEPFRRKCKRVQTIFAEDISRPEDVLRPLAAFVRGKSVFFTIDLDGLDPAIMPAVGTPEPGGISWELTIEIARTICRAARSFRVFDIVELAPIPGFHAPDFLAAKLAHKIMSLALGRPSARTAAGKHVVGRDERPRSSADDPAGRPYHAASSRSLKQKRSRKR